MSKQQLTIRIEEEICEKLKFIADKEKRSINSQYEYFLEKAILDYEDKNGPILISAE